jgi:putative FmdB family regulatory protein
MPTYQYRCPTCKHEFEEFQSMSEEPIRVCPKCKGETHRVISGGAGLIFKGSGFYITDYKHKGDKQYSRDSSGSGTSSSSPKSEPAKPSGNGSKN